MKAFKKYLELKTSPFYKNIKPISKEEYDTLPVWDIEGGIGSRDREEVLKEETDSSEDSDEEVHKSFKHSRIPTKDELNSLKHYTDYSHKINSDSRQGVENEHHKHLDSWLDESKSKNDEFLYHGLKKPPVTGKFKTTSYISTSSDKLIAKCFAKTNKSENEEFHNKKHVLKIYTPKTSKAASVKDYSESPEEKEISIHRHQALEIHPTPTVEGNTVYWHTVLHKNV
jgi:hypothetical protein